MVNCCSLQLWPCTLVLLTLKRLKRRRQNRCRPKYPFSNIHSQISTLKYPFSNIHSQISIGRTGAVPNIHPQHREPVQGAASLTVVFIFGLNKDLSPRCKYHMKAVIKSSLYQMVEIEILTAWSSVGSSSWLPPMLIVSNI